MINLYHMEIGNLNHKLEGCWLDFASRVNGLEQYGSAMHDQLDYTHIVTHGWQKLKQGI